MIDFQAVTPIGARTCCNVTKRVGSEAHTWLDDEIVEHAEEFLRAKEGQLDPALTPAEHADALGALTSLRRKAKEGRLSVGYGKEYLSRRIRRVDYLLELRPKLAKGKPPPRLFRLYYAEPIGIEGALLPLVLATKATVLDLEEQNESIDLAKVRSRVWLLKKGMMQ